MTFLSYSITYRHYGKKYNKYKIPIKESVYLKFISQCKKHNVNPYEFLEYWKEQDFYYPQQLTKDWYFNEYKKHFHQQPTDELFFLLLQYKWIDGNNINKWLPLIDYRKLHSVEETARMYSGVYLATYKDVELILDDSEFSLKLKSVIPYYLDIIDTDLEKLESKIHKLSQQVSLPILTDKQKILLFGGAVI